MPGILHSASAAAAIALLLLLSACDRLRSTEPPPSYESPTLGVARDIGGAQASPAAAAPTAAASAR